jgi:hypothetical protein
MRALWRGNHFFLWLGLLLSLVGLLSLIGGIEDTLDARRFEGGAASPSMGVYLGSFLLVFGLFYAIAMKPLIMRWTPRKRGLGFLLEFGPLHLVISYKQEILGKMRKTQRRRIAYARIRRIVNRDGHLVLLARGHPLAAIPDSEFSDTAHRMLVEGYLKRMSGQGAVPAAPMAPGAFRR